ncbi:fimbrial protein [Alistipes finegoldii]|uniref:fimbrial protein n=1 Tax=Alistipes finegoldii TaxID=214856 RepID=UPI003A91057D
MRKVRYLFFAAFVAACCGGAMSGCIKEEGANPGSDTKNVPVLLNVGTRSVDATDGTPTSEEAMLHTLRVYAFIDSERVGYYYSEVPSEGSVRFLMDMTLKSTTTQTVDFYVVANERAMTDGSHTLSATTTRAQLDGYTFTGLSFTGASLTNGLPMFCKEEGVEINVAEDKDPDAPEDPNPPVNAGDHDGHTQLKQTIPLELRRPVAKLGVFAAKQSGETVDLTITGLALRRQGMRTSNYLMPQSEETLKGMDASGSDTDFALVPVNNPVAELNGAGAGTDGYTPVLDAPFYPFENPWGSASVDAQGDPAGNVLVVSYQFTGSDVRTHDVYLPAMLRNYYYRVRCLIKNSGLFTVEYMVADWENDADDNWESTFEYPTYTNLLTEGHKDAPAPETAPTIYYNSPIVPDYFVANDPSAAGTCSFFFQMSAPVGQRWTPTLMNAATTQYSLAVYDNTDKKVYDNDPNDPAHTAGIEASPNFYRIVVRVLDPDVALEGKFVTLGINTPSWLGDNQLLLINKTDTGTYWPADENDTVSSDILIGIKHIIKQ